MIAVTTPTLEGAPIKRYYGIVSGETISGVNFFKDIGAGLSNLFGGRASNYEEELFEASFTGNVASLGPRAHPSQRQSVRKTRDYAPRPRVGTQVHPPRLRSVEA